MGNKKKKETVFVPVHIVGVFDTQDGILTKVSLEDDEIEMDMALMFEESRYVKCEFDVMLVL